MNGPVVGLGIALTVFVTVPTIILVLCALVEIHHESRDTPPTRIDDLRRRYLADELDSIDFELAVMGLEDPDASAEAPRPLLTAVDIQRDAARRGSYGLWQVNKRSWR